MKIQITGISGFVGQNLAEYLMQHGDTVEGLSMRDTAWRTNFNTQADVIIHLAGKAHDTSNTSSSEAYYRVNRDLTIELYNEFINSGVKDFFYFSSVKAVADTVINVLTETDSQNPLTPYGKSKHEAEQYLLSKELPTGKRLFIIRPCMIHGPGNKGNLNLLYKIVKKGFPWPLASYENKRSFLSIDNLNFLIKEMINNSQVISGVYNFADDEALSTNELVRTIGESLRKSIFLWKVPQAVIHTMARLGDTLKLPLNSERLNKLTESYVVSNLKIKNALGINKLPLTPREGLIITLQSFNKKS